MSVDQNVAVYNRFTHEYTEMQLYPPEREILWRLRKQWHHMDVLDLGVGTGRTTYTFAAVAGQYLGVDYAEEMLKRCRHLVRENDDVQLKCMDARDLSALYGRNFDFVMFSMNGLDSVGHDDRQTILGEVRKVVSPGGYFFFSSHSVTHFKTSRALPSFRWHAPLRSIYHCLQALRFNHRLGRANGGRSEEEIRATEWAVLKTGDHDFMIDIYHVRPASQMRELARLGFRVEAVLDNRGEEVDPNRSESPWLYYLCRPDRP